jgi:hypothetical protein
MPRISQRAVSTVGVLAQDIAQIRDFAAYENMTVLNQKSKQRLSKMTENDLRQVAALSMASPIGMAAMLELSTRSGKVGGWEMFATPGDEITFSVRDAKQPQWRSVAQPKGTEPCA